MKIRFGAQVSAMILIILLMSGCNTTHSDLTAITFPASDNGKNEFNARIYEIEPFVLSIKLPDGWEFRECKPDGDDALIAVFSKHDIFDADGKRAGVVGYNLYEPYEGAENDPRAIYSQIALGNDYQFDVRNSYNVMNESETGATAIVDVYYAASINNGTEKINKGIVSYHNDLLVYIAMELDGDRITDEQLTGIAKSIQITR